MDKKQLNALMPVNKTDVERAQNLAMLDYASVKLVAPEMLRWLRTYRAPADGGDDTSPVAEIFIRFFISNAAAAVEDVENALRTSKQDQLKYVIVTKVLPEWPRFTIEPLKDTLAQLVTNSGNPETALMALRLLAKHDLYDKEWLRSCLSFIADRMERNLREAPHISDTYFQADPFPE